MEAEALVVWIVGLVLGVIEVPVFQYLKNKLGIEGVPALLFVLLASVLIAFVALFATGGYSPFSWDMFLTYCTATIAMAQVVYGLLVRK